MTGDSILHGVHREHFKLALLMGLSEVGFKDGKWIELANILSREVFVLAN